MVNTEGGIVLSSALDYTTVRRNRQWRPPPGIPLTTRRCEALRRHARPSTPACIVWDCNLREMAIG